MLTVEKTLLAPATPVSFPRFHFVIHVLICRSVIFCLVRTVDFHISFLFVATFTLQYYIKMLEVSPSVRFLALSCLTEMATATPVCLAFVS